MAEFQVASTPGRSRFSKALPAPPGGLLQIEPGTRGKISPFPAVQRGKMSPFPSPRPPVTPSKISLPRTPASGISNQSPPIEERPVPTPSFPAKVSLPRTPASGISNQSPPIKESAVPTSSFSSKILLPRTPASGISNQSAQIKESALPTPPLPTPLRITIPQTNTKMPVQISRRPVGAAVVAGAGVGATKSSKRQSDGSVSSIYSEYGRPRSSTGSSYVTKDSSVASDHDDYLPPPPPKDPRRADRGPQETPSTPRRFHSESVSSTASASPGRPEIWRRRSIKGEQRVNIADLKLTKSNGFTESPTAVNKESPIAQQPLAPAPFTLPRSKGNQPGLPGRNIRKPVPARAAPPQPVHSSSSVPVPPQIAQESKTIAAPQSTDLAATGPDDMPPVMDKIKTVFGRKKEEAPLGSPERIEELKAIVSGMTFPAYDDRHQPLPQPRLPPSDYMNKGELISQDTLRSNPVSPASPQTPLETLSHSESQSTIKPARRGDDGAASVVRTRKLSAEPTVQPRADPYSQPQISSTLIETTRKVLSRLPDVFKSASGNISPSFALERSHFDCYARHQKLHEHKNKVHPVACQICLRKDSERRFVCSFCSLRCCNGCHEMLRWDKTGNPDRELAVVLRALGRPDHAEKL